MSQLVLIPQAHVAQAWPLAEPYLDKAAKAGGMQGVNHWLGDCLHGRKQLWAIWVPSQTGEESGKVQGAGVTSLTETLEGLTCIISGFGAERGSSWFETLPVLEDWARSQGCVRTRVYGRTGWVEKLKGYALKGVILDRTL